MIKTYRTTLGSVALSIAALASGFGCGAAGEDERAISDGDELRKCRGSKCDAGGSDAGDSVDSGTTDGSSTTDAGTSPDSGTSDPGGGDIALPPAPAATGKTWQLVFSEEFDGTSYDPSKLTPCFDWNYGDCTASFNQGRERYLPEQVRVSNGTAKLVAEPLSPPYANGGCYEGQCTYKAGLLSTARPLATQQNYLFPFTYGYVESRMKFPAVKGLFTAFWMLPTSPTYSYKTEIDIVEILGHDPSTIWMHYHYNDRASSYRVNRGIADNGACAVKDYSKEFVRFGVDWQPSHIAWYIDGVKCGQYDGPTESGPMQLILHMMVDNSWQRSWNQTLDSLSTVGQLEVDYIRIFQQK